MKFAVADIAYTKDGAKGYIVYVEPGYIVIELDSNGVEMDYKNESHLLTEDEHDALHPKVAKQDSPKGLGLFGTLTYSVRPGDDRLATNVLRMIDKIYPALIAIIEVKENASAIDKLIKLSEKMAVPVFVFLGTGDGNDEKLLRMVIAKAMQNSLSQQHMSESFVSDLLLARAKQAISEYEANNVTE